MVWEEKCGGGIRQVPWLFLGSIFRDLLLFYFLGCFDLLTLSVLPKVTQQVVARIQFSGIEIVKNYMF